MTMVAVSDVRRALKDFDLRSLFVEELGWEPHSDRRYIEVEDVIYELQAVAHKRGMVVYTLVAGAGEALPDSSTRRKIERKLAKDVLEHFIVYATSDKTSQVWQWVKREPGQPAVVREHGFAGEPTESLIQRLRGIAFSLEEEEQLGLPDVWGRIRASFDVEKVTKKFYDLFKKEHDAFLGFIEGLNDEDDCNWYASIMLNRLMFVYFVQKKGFLDNNPNYLRDKLDQMKSNQVDGNFLTFYRRFLLKLFHEGLGTAEDHRTSEIDRLIGKIPYLNGGIFDIHEIEESNPDLDVADEAFERLFDFFDGYRWHLDERPLRQDNEINPDVLGYIFEKYVNQKQMGAYYTQEDVTGYISQNTIVPYLFDAAKEGCAVAFEPGSAMWSLLSENPDRYIYEAVLKGVDEPLPEEIAAGLDDVSARTGWNRPADEEYALPTETWREHVARRRRCEDLRSRLSSGEIHEINDLITLNLDIRQFAQDAVQNAEGPELVRAFYEALRNISVLDPTCGSGAFLFAALNILEPLYEACLERMRRFVDEDISGESYKDFRRTIAEMKRHENMRYFILKSIMVNNLYGVDIMEEAVEIARLRMFLKLMAQVEGNAKIEPLPDLDFNLRAGNTLVGFATLDEVQEALTRKLDFENVRERIETKASEADDAFQIFRWMQIEERTDSEELGQAKDDVRTRLHELNDELDRYLASEYGVDIDDTTAFVAWRESHLPFHWVAEFFGIMQGGGFDVVVGNPPFVEYREIAGIYTVRHYRTERCGNLYAFVAERVIGVLNAGGHWGLIIPVASVCTDRYLSLQNLLSENGNLLISAYNDRPGKLFEGLEHIRLCIVLQKKEKTFSLSVFSTTYNRWRTIERPTLFHTLLYAASCRDTSDGIFLKFGFDVETQLLRKISAQKRTLDHYSHNSNHHEIYYTRKLSGFVQILDFIPVILDEDGNKRDPSELKRIAFPSEQTRDVFLSLLNSNLFFWFLTVRSDCRNLNKREVAAIRFDIERASAKTLQRLSTLAGTLMEHLDDNSELLEVNYQRLGKMSIQNIYPKLSKPIIDEIDRVLAEHYGFTDEELDFIINYDIKYRMGVEQG